MGKPQDTISLTLILLPLLYLVLIFSLMISSPNIVFAQHEMDPETWIEMRKMFRNKGPTPTIDEDIAALAGPEAKRAGPRLIDRGPEALPSVYAAISLEAPGLDAIIRNDIRKAVWRIINTDDEFTIVPANSASTQP